MAPGPQPSLLHLNNSPPTHLQAPPRVVRQNQAPTARFLIPYSPHAPFDPAVPGFQCRLTPPQQHLPYLYSSLTGRRSPEPSPNRSVLIPYSPHAACIPRSRRPRPPMPAWMVRLGSLQPRTRYLPWTEGKYSCDVCGEQLSTLSHTVLTSFTPRDLTG